jgi:hypothetical protein
VQVEMLKKEVRKRDKELKAKQAAMDEDLAMIEEAMAAEAGVKVGGKGQRRGDCRGGNEGSDGGLT